MFVDDVDAHYDHAKRSGATVVREPEDQFYGDRNYGAHDPEGHEWYFGTHVHDMSEDEMRVAVAATN